MDFTQYWLLFNTLMLIVLIVGCIIDVHARVVKIGVLVLVCSTILYVFRSEGPFAAQKELLIIFLWVFVIQMIGLMIMRIPRKIQSRRAGVEECPERARKNVTQWTEELMDQGFHWFCDSMSEGDISVKKHKYWVRFFRHTQYPIWVELQVSVPKGKMAPVLLSLAESEALATVDRLHDFDLFGDVAVRINYRRKKIPLKERMDSHLRCLSPQVHYLDIYRNPEKASLTFHEFWLNRGLNSGRLSLRGEGVGITLVNAPLFALKALGNYLR